LFSQLKANLEASVDVEVVSAFDLTDAETQKNRVCPKRKAEQRN